MSAGTTQLSPLITPQNAQNRELSPFRSSEESISTLHADHPYILTTQAGLPHKSSRNKCGAYVIVPMKDRITFVAVSMAKIASATAATKAPRLGLARGVCSLSFSIITLRRSSLGLGCPLVY